MTDDVAPLNAARSLAQELGEQLQAAPTFRELDGATRSALLRDVAAIRSALGPPATGPARVQELDQELAVPAWRRAPLGSGSPGPDPSAAPAPAQATPGSPAPRSATASLAENTGRLADEIGFGAFVAGLVHSTFSAIVDATIKQMEEFADLVRTLARNVEDFTRDNVTENQARDLLVQRHPHDLQLVPESDVGDSGEGSGAGVGTGYKITVRQSADGEARSPTWLSDYGLGGRELDDDLAEQELVPAARRVAGEDRMQLLATMVLLGMNRVVVRDGRISAKVRIRAQAHDTTQVAVSQDPGGDSNWGTRGGSSQSMYVSTVGVNVQSDADLHAELFGEVEVNFASETVPLERFAEPARLALLQRNSRTAAASASPAPATPPTAPAPPAAQVAAPAGEGTPPAAPRTGPGA
jgi:hypothetical protein